MRWVAVAAWTLSNSSVAQAVPASDAPDAVPQAESETTGDESSSDGERAGFPGPSETTERSNVLGGHRFILTKAFVTGFTTTYVASEVGAGYARQTVFDPGPVAGLMGEDEFSLLTGVLGADAQIRLADWIAVRFSASGLIYVGTGLLAAINSGATGAFDAQGGAVLGWTIGDWRLGVTADLGYGYDFVILPAAIFEDADAEAFSNINSFKTGGSLVASWGVTPWLGISGRFLLAYTYLWQVNETTSDDGTTVETTRLETDGVSVGGGLMLDFDLLPVVRWPISLLTTYTPVYASVSKTTSHFLTVGIFYSEFDSFQMGLDARLVGNRITAVAPDRENRVLTGVLTMRYLWN